MDQFDSVHTKPLRTIPINRTVDDPRRIMPYENVKGIVDSQDFLAVARCACRQRKLMVPGSTGCTYPEEVCLHLGDPARYLVENGMARRISKEEALDILKVAADAGLVHAVSNRQHEVDTICNCCTCSCLFFESYHALKHEKSHDFSNYRVKINPGTGKACGLCVQHCPVRALKLEDSPLASNEQGKAAKLVDPSHCLGCGVCVHACPTQSLILESRPEVLLPPKDMHEWMKRWVTNQKQEDAAEMREGK